MRARVRVRVRVTRGAPPGVTWRHAAGDPARGTRDRDTDGPSIHGPRRASQYNSIRWKRTAGARPAQSRNA